MASDLLNYLARGRPVGSHHRRVVEGLVLVVPKGTATLTESAWRIGIRRLRNGI